MCSASRWTSRQPLEREPAACRKLATRAREHVREAKPRFGILPSAARCLRTRSTSPTRWRRIDPTALPAEDVWSLDGGGKRSAATKPVVGLSR